MKQLLGVALMLFLPLALTAENHHMKFTQSGEFASFSASPDPLTNVNLTVSRSSSTTGGSSANLNYFSFTVAPDFNSETFVQIVGEIPTSAFTGQSTQDLVLNLDTSTLDPTTTFNESCTLDLTTFIETCSPGPLGLIHLEFHENGIQRTQVLDFDEVITNGSNVTRIHQTSDNGTANMNGSIFGVPFSSTSATVGVNFGTTVEFMKKTGHGDDDDQDHDRDKDRDHHKGNDKGHGHGD